MHHSRPNPEIVVFALEDKKCVATPKSMLCIVPMSKISFGPLTGIMYELVYMYCS